MTKNVEIFCKQIKFVIISLSLSLGIFVAGSCSRNEKQQNKELSSEVMDKFPNISISDSVLNTTRAVADFDFGRISSGEIIEKILIIKNSGKSSFLIEHIKTDCGCITVNYPEEPILPGQRRSVRLSFTSRGQHGWANKTVEFKTSINEKTFKLNTKCEIDN